MSVNITLHKKLNIFMSVGLLANALSVQTFYGSHSDPGFISKQSLQWISLVLFVSGLALIALGLGLYVDEKENEATLSLASAVQQKRKQNAAPSLNETALLAGLMAGTAGLVGIWLAIHTNRTSNAKLVPYSVKDNVNQVHYGGHLLFVAAWIGLAFAASTNSRDLDDVHSNRLPWLLPGAVLIGIAPFLLHEQVFNNVKWISSLSLGVTSLWVGSVLFDFGAVYTAEPLQFTGRLAI